MKEIEVKFRYHGGSADESKLEIYDAGISLRGMSRALAITTHAFIHNGALRKRAERAVGAKIYICPAKEGSFLETVVVALSNDAVKNIGYSIAAAAFWDFLKWSWSAAIGKSHTPQTHYVKEIKKRNDFLEEALAANLETPLAELHRPIETDNHIKIAVERPRVGKVIILNKDSLDYVTTRKEAEIKHKIYGNVTKYNILSGFGRYYDDQEARTISFDIVEELPQQQKMLLTWSMDQRNRGNGGKLLIDAIRVVNAHGCLMRYTITNVEIAANEVAT